MVLKADNDPQVHTAYRVETDRLVLRCWSPADAPVLRAALDACDAHLRPIIQQVRLLRLNSGRLIAWVIRSAETARYHV